jgi:hypothetical protein
VSIVLFPKPSPLTMASYPTSGPSFSTFSNTTQLAIARRHFEALQDGVPRLPSQSSANPSVDALRQDVDLAL